MLCHPIIVLLVLVCISLVVLLFMFIWIVRIMKSINVTIAILEAHENTIKNIVVSPRRQKNLPIVLKRGIDVGLNRL